MTNAISKLRFVFAAHSRHILARPKLEPHIPSTKWYCGCSGARRHLRTSPRTAMNEPDDPNPLQHQVTQRNEQSKTTNKQIALAEQQRRADGYIQRTYKTRSVSQILQALTDKSVANPAHYIQSYSLARYLLQRLSTEVDMETVHNVIRCLIYANAAPDGSVGRVIKHLAEMEYEKISLNAEDCLAILKVLAVHPDLVLRTHVLQYMESSWIGLTEEAHHYVIAGLFRELQLEQAIQELLTMKENNLRIEPWLFDLAISILASVGELEEAKELLKMKTELHGGKLPLDFGVYLLSKAVDARNLDLAKFICQNYMDEPDVTISPGIMTGILEIAAQNGDIEYVNLLLRWFYRIHGPVRPAQYEIIIATLANAGHIKGALELLCLMHENAIIVDHNHTRCIHSNLKVNPVSSAEVFDSIIMPLHETGRRVPLAALNLALELYNSENENISTALRIFDSISKVSSEEPNSSTYYHLFEASRGSLSKQIEIVDHLRNRDDEIGIKIFDTFTVVDTNAAVLFPPDGLNQNLSEYTPKGFILEDHHDTIKPKSGSSTEA